MLCSHSRMYQQLSILVSKTGIHVINVYNVYTRTKNLTNAFIILSTFIMLKNVA